MTASTASANGRLLVSVLAGATALVLTAAPGFLIVRIIALGALGEPDYATLGGPTLAMYLGVGVGAGMLVYRWLGRAWTEAGRRPADAWIAFVVVLTIVVCGVMVIPVVIVFITVDSDHGLADRARLVAALWYAGHGGLVALAYVAGRFLFDTGREPAAVRSK